MFLLQWRPNHRQLDNLFLNLFRFKIREASKPIIAGPFARGIHLWSFIQEWSKTSWHHHLPLIHWGRDTMDAFWQTTFSNAFSWMKIYEFRLKFLVYRRIYASLGLNELRYKNIMTVFVSSVTMVPFYWYGSTLVTALILYIITCLVKCESVEWNWLSIPKLQLLHRWSLRIDE